MHPQNPYRNRYDLNRLVKHHTTLKKYIVSNPAGEETIDFSSSSAVLELNKSMFLADFKLEDYQLPTGYLIPPVPGRLDYLLHLRDFLSDKSKLPKDAQLKGLDIGTGANGIYCILGAQYFNWQMVGAESDAKAVEIAKSNILRTEGLKHKVEIRWQENKGFLFKNIVGKNEQFDFTVCNPPFYSSEEAAVKENLRKLQNLEGNTDKKERSLNFEGQANELWCNGGEALFIKRLIKESVFFKDQVKVFSSLVAKSDNLPKIEKQLKKAKADYHMIPMAQGNKKSRIVLWWF
ncbi:23S rRNA (adenine(1618)-N(6))-methyltransferase RlmF [Maribacter sp. MMG018]|uniref:23S rRNA (adenine(1618)-N(6))-methyltransferase RlmF n=1 Tax=Maribacter sp. MMG018 TaxID=2822688 RepID=UPI001B36D5E1|nr:23S rRNA (adenine(1618)-N(6))-methyltransferase RlmF [Maribacter sp. MMG018]MBQ4915044.1 23S rRNA (adenine(1618)-N(6))-methyltransferase RlmF [Maribacter sp. MMG018]